MRSYISFPLLLEMQVHARQNSLPVLPSPSPFSISVLQDCPAGQSNISDSVFLKVWLSKKTLNCFRVHLPPPFQQPPCHWCFHLPAQRCGSICVSLHCALRDPDFTSGSDELEKSSTIAWSKAFYAPFWQIHLMY